MFQHLEIGVARVSVLRVILGVAGLQELCTARIRAAPWLRFKRVLIPTVRRHYRGRKVVLCMDRCKSMNNPDKARWEGGMHI